MGVGTFLIVSVDNMYIFTRLNPKCTFVFPAFLKKYVDGKIDILETTMNDKKYIKSKTTTYSLVSEMNLLTGALTKKSRRQ